MSELTCCNHCSFAHIKRLHKGEKLEQRKEDGGVAIYANDKFIAWFMELPDHCCC